jgi:hypothetical protein
MTYAVLLVEDILCEVEKVIDAFPKLLKRYGRKQDPGMKCC